MKPYQLSIYLLLLITALVFGQACVPKGVSPEANTLPAPSTYEPYLVPPNISTEYKERPSTYGGYNVDYYDFLPDTLYPKQFPRKDLYVSFHFMNTQDTFYRQYEGEAAFKYIEGLLYAANKDLKDNRKNSLDPIGVVNPVYPVRYKMFLAKKPGTDEPAIYHHYDDDQYAFIFRGPKRNLGDRQVIRDYGVDVDHVLNIFVMPPHRDSLTSPTFKPNDITGVFLGNSIKLAGFYPDKRPAWEHRGNLNHEVGHALGLNHAWLTNDGCDDTRTHPNKCWSRSQSAFCDTMTSNNVMDYSAVQNAWTPCQIGRIHAKLSNPNSRQRKWLRRTWCSPYDKSQVIVEADVEWKGARDFRRDIIIKTGTVLTINGRVHMARGQTITVEAGARLVLGPKARLHNACGTDWGGIVIEAKGTKRGEVVLDPEATIENLAK